MAMTTPARRHGLYVDGAFYRDPSQDAARVTGEREVLNPATSEMVGTVPTGGRDLARHAIAQASEAFSSWRNRTGKERGTFLFRWRDAVEARADELAETITRENGKPIEQAEGEVSATLDHLRWFAEEARRGYGRVVPGQAEGKRHYVVKQPVGVVGAISPWNFPLVLAVRKAAPALAAGCPVVLKPADRTPLCCAILAECADEAGLPAGTFNLVLGPPAEIADEMIENDACRKITFTGSTRVGRSLMQKAGPYVKDLSLELGGNGPFVVFADADVEQAVEEALAAKYRNTGQSCIAANRFFVQKEIADAFTDAFVQATRDLKVGAGMEGGVDVGPMIDGDAVEQGLSYVEEAADQGAEVLCGGERLDGDAYGAGHFMAPTVLGKVHDDMRCMTEETFAPLAPIAPFETFDEAVERANDTIYGLSAYVFSSDFSTALRAGEELEAGTVGINDGVPSTTDCPFGGMKQSGLGRELGKEGMEAFLKTKHMSAGVWDQP
jgi:succinate-semialdehyde dehydrogenase/glutarate-semialdehyde dehydrogenase